MEQIINALDAPGSFPKILREARESGRETVIQHNDQPVAVLISYEQYQEFLALQQQAKTREERFAIYDEIRARNLDATPEQVRADIAEAVAAVRAEQQ